MLKQENGKMKNEKFSSFKSFSRLDSVNFGSFHFTLINLTLINVGNKGQLKEWERRGN